MTVHFEPNVPQTLALQEPTAEKFAEYEITYTLTDGRLLKVSKQLAAKINELDLQPGETFGICKQMVFNEQRKRNTPSWTVWLSPESEKTRAQHEMHPPMTLADVKGHGKLRAIRQAKQAPLNAAYAMSLGTGTNGPAPLPQSLRPARIPYNQAFREVLQFVTASVNDLHEWLTVTALKGFGRVEVRSDNGIRIYSIAQRSTEQSPNRYEKRACGSAKHGP